MRNYTFKEAHSSGGTAIIVVSEDAAIEWIRWTVHPEDISDFDALEFFLEKTEAVEL